MRGELQLISSCSTFSRIVKGPTRLSSSFSLWSWEVEVGRVQPDLVTDLVVARRRFLFVVLSFHVGRCLLQRVAGFSMNVAHRRYELLCRWVGDGVVVRGVRNKTRVSSIQDEERALARCAVDPIVVCEFCERQPVGPVVLSIVNEDSEILLNLLVNSFGLAIRLRMPGGRCIWRDIKQSVKLLHELGDELRSSVADYDLRHAVLGVDVILENSCPSFG